MTRKTFITGSLKPQENSLLHLHTELFLKEPLALNLGRGSGNPGHPASAKPLFGWPFVTDVGLLIVCRKEDYLTLPAARCPLCDQEDETIQHLLTTCVFARQFWFSVLQPLNLTHLVPSRTSSSLADWWKKSWKKLQKQLRKGFNSLVILGAWIIWKHRNACIFDGAAPNLQRALQAFKDEFHLWQISGAKGLTTLSLEGVAVSS